MATGLWRDALRLIRARTNPKEFGTWFTATRCLGIEGRVVRLRVPNAAFASQIEGTYRTLILESVRAVGGDALEVRCDSGARRIRSQPAEAPEDPVRSEPLHPEHAFRTFVVGDSNRAAWQAAREVSQPGTVPRRFNPLLIYGPIGLGKTHLLQAIGRRIREQDPEARVVHTRGQVFTRQVVDAIRSNRLFEFRDRCDATQVLLIDDLEFIAGLDTFSRTTEEFLYLLEALASRGRQIVVTAKRHPGEMDSLDQRIRSRLEAGLAIPVRALDENTAVMLVGTYARGLGLQIEAADRSRIASRYNRSGREIRGVVNQLLAHHEGDGPVPAATVDQVLRDLPAQPREAPSVQRIMVATANALGVPPLRLKSRSRTQDVTLARHVAMYLARHTTSVGAREIAAAFEKDPSTVRYGIRRVANQRKLDAGLDELVRRLELQLS